RCHNLFPMSRQEFLPRGLSAPFRRRFYSMLLQNVGHRLECEQVTEIGQCPLNSAIAPAAILLRHARHQLRNLANCPGSPWTAVSAAVIFLSNQFSMPSQKRLWSHDGGELVEELSADLLRFRCQSATLIIVETHAAVADLLSKDPILLDQILDELLLMLVHPAGQRDNDERKWIKERAHRCTLSRDSASHFSQCFKSLRIFAPG